MVLSSQNSFLDKYLSESEPEGEKSDEQKQKEKQVERYDRGGGGGGDPGLFSIGVAPPCKRLELTLAV